MGISGSTTRSDTSSSSGDQNFSRDVLKVEISGPNRSYFSILDVPGVFQSATHDITKEERDGVREMVASYMAPKQSVIMFEPSAQTIRTLADLLKLCSRWDLRSSESSRIRDDKRARPRKEKNCRRSDKM